MKRTKYKSARPGVVNSLPQKLAIYAVLILGSMAMLLPFFWMISTAFKKAGDVFLLPIQWIPKNPTLENFQRVFTEFEFQHYIWNTVWLTAINMVGFMLSCALVAYGFATHVVILDDEGRVKEVYAAHDSGKVVNPIAIQGQIEGGVLMGLGYALTEDFPLKNSVPQAKYGTLGLLRSTQIPDIHAIYVEKEELLPFAYGAKGIGEIATIPTAPAVQGAYYAMDHILRTRLPMENTYYSKKQKAVR